MISPIWLDGPWQGKDHKMNDYHVRSGLPFEVRVVDPPEIGPYAKTAPVDAVNYTSHIYHFYKFVICKRILIVASASPTPLWDNPFAEERLADLILNDQAKKAILS